MTCSYTIYGSEIFIRVHQLVFIGHEFITTHVNYSVTIARDTRLEPWDRGCMAQRALRALLHEKQNGGRRKETKRILQKV